VSTCRYSHCSNYTDVELVSVWRYSLHLLHIHTYQLRSRHVSCAGCEPDIHQRLSSSSMSQSHFRPKMLANSPKTGQIAITLPPLSATQTINPNCLVEGATSRPYECVIDGTVLFINKLYAYPGNSPALLILTSIALTAAYTSLSNNFSARVYATAGTMAVPSTAKSRKLLHL
jgi:hypothetical protein